MIELGEQLLVAAADRAVKEALSHRLDEQTWIRVGHPTPETPWDERMAILKRFKKTSRKNGHHKAWSQWGDAQATVQRLAEEILEIPSNDSIGNGIRAYAALVIDHDHDNAFHMSDPLWEMPSKPTSKSTTRRGAKHASRTRKAR